MPDNYYTPCGTSHNGPVNEKCTTHKHTTRSAATTKAMTKTTSKTEWLLQWLRKRGRVARAHRLGWLRWAGMQTKSSAACSRTQKMHSWNECAFEDSNGRISRFVIAHTFGNNTKFKCCRRRFKIITIKSTQLSFELCSCYVLLDQECASLNGLCLF